MGVEQQPLQEQADHAEGVILQIPTRTSTACYGTISFQMFKKS